MAKQQGVLIGYPWTRFTDRRARSHVCAVVDGVAIACGTALFLVAAVDVLATWPSGRVLLPEPDLSRLAEVTLFPAWVWLFASMLVVFGTENQSDRHLWLGKPFPQQSPFPVLWRGSVRTALKLAMIIAGFMLVLGIATGAKGDVRTLPGPTYQVSTCSINDCDWTSITPAQYRSWRARFLRQDGVFPMFGVFLVGGCTALLRLHRFVAHPSG